MEPTKPELETTENSTTLPPVIMTTLDIIDKRYISAQQKREKQNKYQKNLHNESIKISQLYFDKDDNLFYNGFINEGCFFLACQYSFQNGWGLSRSNAKQDLKGTDFVLCNGKRKYNFDVTISSSSYARKLTHKSITPLLLPIYSPEDQKTYAQLFLEQPTNEDYEKYLKHIIFHNRRILNNEFPHKFDIEITRKKKDKPSTTVSNNGSLLYHIKFQQSKYNKIRNILQVLEQSTP